MPLSPERSRSNSQWIITKLHVSYDFCAVFSSYLKWQPWEQLQHQRLFMREWNILKSNFYASALDKWKLYIPLSKTSHISNELCAILMKYVTFSNFFFTKISKQFEFEENNWLNKCLLTINITLFIFE